MFAEILGYSVPSATAWVSPVLGTVVYLYGGWPFLTGAVAEIRARQPGMMLLVALAITVAFVASGLTSLGVGGLDLDFWWELALLVVIMLLGHWLEMRALSQASGALDALASLLPDEAERIGSDGLAEAVPLAEIHEGDLVLVRSGGRVPADGVITAGQAELDESMITGESRTVGKSAGDRVVAGTVVTDSTVRVRVDAVGERTALAGIRRLVEQAQNSRSRAQALADRAAAALFYFASIAGLITFATWLTLGQPDDAIERTVTVLVIACPHALGLAIPLVVAISTTLAARAGILVKDRLALERMRSVTAVLFDKTGTLTKGQPAVTAIETAGDNGPDGQSQRQRVLALAAAVEADSEHPLARAIVTSARASDPVPPADAARPHPSRTHPASSSSDDAASPRVPGELPSATDFHSLPGRGVQAVVDGSLVAVGGPALVRERGVDLPDRVREAAATWSGRGATVLYVLRGGRVEGALALEDEIRPESADAVKQLHRRGVHVVMITGDARPVAEAVADQLGIDEVFADVLPQDKDAKVSELQGRGLRVAMVGDGVNDAPALARADVGIAIGAGTDVAIESAGVVLASDDPRAVLGAFTLSQASYRKMQQNLAWAAGYNLVSVPLAAGVLAPLGFVLAPAVGAILMSASTIIVAANAQLLRRVRLRPESPPERFSVGETVGARRDDAGHETDDGSRTGGPQPVLRRARQRR